MAINITNKHNLPEIFLKACMIDTHVTRGEISTTQIIDAPQIRQLRRHNDIEEDVSDRIWMLFGTAMHHILERAEIDHYRARSLMEACQVLDQLGADDSKKVADWLRDKAHKEFPEAFESKDLIENTMSVIVDGMEISGTCDVFRTEEGILQDYKVTGTWAYIYEEAKKKWYAQQNIYAYMLRENGYTVNSASIIGIFKDWSKMKTLRSKDYPPSAIMDIDVPLIPHEKVHKYLQKRVALHRKAQSGEHVPCSAKERWATADAFAVKKKGGKKAVRVLPSLELAENFIKDNEGFKYTGLYIEHRPGEQKRCKDYCAVSEFCPQWKKFQEENDIK